MYLTHVACGYQWHVCVTLEITGILLECTAWLFTLFVWRGTRRQIADRV